MNKTQAFELWQEYKTLQLTPAIVADIQEKWEETVKTLHKTLIGRKQGDFFKAYNNLKSKGYEDLLEKEMKSFKEEVNKRFTEFKEDKKAKENLLREFSKTYQTEFLDEMIVVKKSSAYDYWTQTSACKYAREALTEDKLLLEFLGYQTEVKASNGHMSGGMFSRYSEDYELWANISEFDFQMLQWSGKFISVLNWAVLCWQKGTNPKVYCPFLSDDDYQKSQILAYYTNYDVTRENMSLELSWDEITKIRKP